jgi:sterol desaturase/sphingolipid hydroxylase (fatty acid hydroxylase superfamily)
MKLDTSILLHAIPAYLLLIIIEGIFLVKEHRKSSTVKEFLASCGLGVGYVILSPFTKGINLFTYTFLYQYRICDLTQHVVFAWIVCFLGDDLTYYFSHRLSHEVRFLWASHSVHHSAETFSLSAAFRQSWTNNLTGTFMLWAWLPLIGINPAMLLFTKSVNAIYQFWLHTESIKKLPRFIEYIFNTPSHHRVHHGSDVEYLDKNHGGILMIWDRMFGTYQNEIHIPQYGLTKHINSNNPFIITFFEWKNLVHDLQRSKCISDFLGYIFKAPGWSKDGTRKTTRDLQKLELKHTTIPHCNGNCSTCKIKNLPRKENPENNARFSA